MIKPRRRSFVAWPLVLCAIWFAISASSAEADLPAHPSLCIVPVQDGQATNVDLGDAWRITSDVITLPGVARPIIYAAQRSGVWTIDPNNALILFGGAFPFRSIYDRYALDPATGTVLALSSHPFANQPSFRAIFRIRPGEVGFTSVIGAENSLLHIPQHVTWVPRMKEFIVSDATGLYHIAPDGETLSLLWSAEGKPIKPSRTYDLPQINALLIVQDGGPILLRSDDGRIDEMPRPKDSFVEGVEVASDGSKLKIYVGNRDPIEVPIPEGYSYDPDAAGAVPDYHSTDTRSHPEDIFYPRNQSAEAAMMDAIGRSVRINPDFIWIGIEGAWDTIKTIPRSLAGSGSPLPVGYPAAQAVLLVTDQNVLAIDKHGDPFEVVGGREVGGSIRGPFRFDDKVLITGRRALFVALDTRLHGVEACAGMR